MSATLTPAAPATVTTGRPCSNCGGTTAQETASDATHVSAIYSCRRCGQREVVTWRAVCSYVVEDITIQEAAHVILEEA